MYEWVFFIYIIDSNCKNKNKNPVKKGLFFELLICIQYPNFCDVFTCLNYSEYEAQVKHLEESKEKFTEYEKQDVKCREDLKHNKQKSKKLKKQLEQEKKKVSDKAI
jgi:hypothetical protein